MNTEALKQKLAGKLSLPSLPDVITKLQKKLREPGVGMKDLGAELGNDPPLTARVLRIANSAYYSLSVPVLDVSHAAAILGLDTMNSLLMQIGVMDVYEHLERKPPFDPRHLWEHSIFTAQVAASFPTRLQRFISKEELYVCGLLHDIGKFVLYDHLRDEYLECVHQSQAAGSLNAVEKASFDFTHADVGALVAERWGLPEQAVRAIGGHHDYRGLAGTDPVVAIIALANVIARDMRGKKAPRLSRELPANPLKCLELTTAEIDGLLERCIELQEPAQLSHD